MKKNILSTISDKWTNRPANFAWLAFFRISVSAFCIIHFLSLLPDINLFLSQHAVIPPDVLDIKASRVVPTLYSISAALGHVTVTYKIIHIFTALYLGSLSMLALGLFTRFSAIAATFLHLILLNSMVFYIYGVDCFCSVVLFYCILFPVGRYFSLDNQIFRAKTINPAYTNFCLTLFQAHICIAYFFGGFDKLLGFNWWNGESIWKALHLAESPKIFNLDFLAHTPAFVIAGWLTIVVEIFYPVFINIKKTRKTWLILVAGMHLFIAIFLGLFFFSAFMMLLNLSAYYLPYYNHDAVARVTGRRLHRQPWELQL
jgi:Vitamin K-dependent gamma-carboxylase